MDQLRERVRERALDTLDWIDYRPDPHWWQYLAVPIVIALAIWLTPMHLGVFLLIGAVALTIVAAIIWGLGLATCVAWRAVRDIIQSMLRRRRAAYPRPLIWS